MLRALVVGLALLCGGCGAAQQAQLQQRYNEAKQRHTAEIADCNRLHPDRTRKPVTPRVRCINQANISFASQGDPSADLIGVMGAQMLVVAEQYDAGRLSVAQFEAGMANAYSEYTTRAMQRQNSAAMASAAQQQAAAANMQAYSANRPRTCNAYGNTVTCY